MPSGAEKQHYWAAYVQKEVSCIAPSRPRSRAPHSFGAAKRERLDCVLAREWCRTLSALFVSRCILCRRYRHTTTVFNLSQARRTYDFRHQIGVMIVFSNRQQSEQTE